MRRRLRARWSALGLWLRNRLGTSRTRADEGHPDRAPLSVREQHQAQAAFYVGRWG